MAADHRSLVCLVMIAAAATPLYAGPPMGSAFGTCEARYPFDAQDAWIHGYCQDAPAYGGFNAFRPYNYKHVLMQSQTVASWGMSPGTPYAQQLWQSPSQTAMRERAAGNIVPVSAFSIVPHVAAGRVVPASAASTSSDGIEPWPLSLGGAGQH